MMAGIDTITLIVTITLAFVGYVATYLNNLALTRRTERLKLITSQLNELYGPMFVITQTGKVFFQAIRAKAEDRGRLSVNEDAPKSADEISEWRIWIEEVFLPLNEQLQQIIIQKAHLIREESMPLCLKAFSAHHAGYKALVRKWHDGDFSESTSLIPYPEEIIFYAENSYLELKAEQMRVIARRKRLKRLGQRARPM
jgi:hypothetical protein